MKTINFCRISKINYKLYTTQGGGWCDTFNECFVRATQSAAKLGSSKKWIDNPVCNSYHPSDKKAQPCHADGG